MRRRSRRTSPTAEERGAPGIDTRHRVDADGTSTDALDQALRVLARMLARQAARKVFERQCVRDGNSEDLP
jgi:hypothetical protein